MSQIVTSLQKAQDFFHTAIVPFMRCKVHAEQAMRRREILFAVALAAVAVSQAVHAAPAKVLFGAVRTPASGAPAVHGTTSLGCLGGAVALAPEGPGWQVLRPARSRNWGHPALLEFVARLAGVGQGLGWPAVLVGDMSQPRGGPMPSGHASHQTGIDVDIWFRRPARRLSAAELADPRAESMVAGDRISVTRAFTADHAALLGAAARDAAVDRIFVNAAIKAALCRSVPAAERGWLRKLRPWWGHDSHFHVRLTCPEGQTGCVAQAPIPEGDGCDASLDWWFSDEALNPVPPATPPAPKPPVMLADLPAACAGVLGAR